MNFTIIYIIILMIIIYGVYFGYINYKKKKQKEVLSNINLKAESANAKKYLERLLSNDLSFIKEQTGINSIDALNYANIEYSTKDSIKDGIKDGLKGMATLGAVKFHTVQTPKYLILSDNNLHFLDTSTDGNIKNHLIFDAFRLEKSSISEFSSNKIMNSYAEAKGGDIKAYKISLHTDEKPIELIIFSSLIFSFPASTNGNFSLNSQRMIEERVIASDFLNKLGDKFPNLKIS